MDNISLTVEDTDSSTWKKIRKQLEYELNSMRKQNDKDHEEQYTCRIRGRISMCKEILKLDPGWEDK